MISFVRSAAAVTAAWPWQPVARAAFAVRGFALSSSTPGTSLSTSTSVQGTETPPPLPLHSSYEQWVRRLYQTNLFHPVKLGLQNITALHEALGKPLATIPVIHIAGTNGKGSVALKIANSFIQSDNNYTVGLFCSPHISCFRERMQINGQLISEQDVVKYLPRIYETCKTNNIPATFFEITTALAFLYFQQHCNVVVLETGLGGRLDATNILTSPALSIITSIGLEHTRILGDTLELIAREKGGIIKPGCPVLVGPHVPNDILKAQAAELNAKGYYTCQDLMGENLTETTDYDVENTRIAKAALLLLGKEYPHLALTLENINQGTLIRPPCRFEIIHQNNHNLTIVLDVAHNPPAMEYLLQKLNSTYPHCKIRIVVGMSADKDLGHCASMLLNTTNAIHLVQACHPRAATLEQIFAAAPLLEQVALYNHTDRSITTQIHSATQLAIENNEILVVCGSVFLMTEAREALGFDEPRDSEYIAEVAGAHLRHGQEIFANTDPETLL